MALWPVLLLLLLLVVVVAEASELTCFFPGKVTKALFGGQCLQYQLMYEGSCRSYFRLESSGLLCLLEADVFSTARVNPHDVTCPSTEESDCVRYRRYCGGGHHVHNSGPCGPSGCHGLPPLPSRDSYRPCSYSRCPKPPLAAPGGVYDLPRSPWRDDYPRCGASGCASVVYGPPANCPPGTCSVRGQCLPLGHGNSVQGCHFSQRRNPDVKTILLRSFHGAMQTVLRTLQRKVNYKRRSLHA